MDGQAVTSSSGGAVPWDRRVWGIVFVAALVRFAWALSVDSATRHRFILFDSSFYLRSALRLWAGEGYVTVHGDPTAYFPPGYSVLLAPIVGIFGAMRAPALLNASAGVLTCMATYEIAARAHGPRAGRLACLLLATLPGYVMATSAIMSEVLFTFLLCSAVLGFVRLRAAEKVTARRDVARWGLLGLCLGATTLVRGPAVLLPGLFGLLLLFEHGARRIVLLRTGAMLLGCALALAPWAIRNVVVMGAFIPIASNGDWSLFSAHNPVANGEHHFGIARLRQELFPDAHALGPTEREVALGRAQRRYALEYAATHPLEELQQIPRRLRALHAGDSWARQWIGRPAVSPRSDGNVLVVISPEADRRLGMLADGAYWVLLVLAAVGVPLALRDAAPPTWVAPGIILYFHVLHGLIFFGSPRFHVPFLPMLAIVAGVTLDRMSARCSAEPRA